MEPRRLSHYELRRLLGRGGMGEVHEAVDLDLERPVALKFVAPEMAGDPEALRRFEREARSAAALHHPHIATVFAFDRSTERPFLAMELLSGESLRDRLQSGPMAVDTALALVRDVATGLAAAHRAGIIHRDIKPENLMFSRDGTIKITDFGLARAVQSTRLTMTGSTLGTAAYMPPEALRGASAAGPATPESPSGAPADVWALGVVLYEMLAGALPFAGDSPLAQMFTIANEAPEPLPARRPDVPEAVAALVARLLDKDPAARPTAADVVRELSALAGSPLPAGFASAPPAATRPADTGAARPTGEPSTVRTLTMRLPGTEDLPVERVPGGSLAPAAPHALEERRRPPRRGLRFAVLGFVAVVAIAMSLVGVTAWRKRRDEDGRRQALVLSNQGLAQWQEGDATRAEATFWSAIRLAPAFAPSYVNQVQLLRATGRAAQADSLLSAAQQRFTGDAAASAMLSRAAADIAMERGEWPIAASDLAEALAHDSSSAQAYNDLGYALTRAGRPADAAAVLQRGVARFPGVPNLLKNLGEARLRLDQPADALPHLDAAIAANDERVRPAALALRAQAHARLERAADALADWRAYQPLSRDSVERAETEAALRLAGVLR